MVRSSDGEPMFGVHVQKAKRAKEERKESVGKAGGWRGFKYSWGEILPHLRTFSDRLHFREKTQRQLHLRLTAYRSCQGAPPRSLLVQAFCRNLAQLPTARESTHVNHPPLPLTNQQTWSMMVSRSSRQRRMQNHITADIHPSPLDISLHVSLVSC